MSEDKQEATVEESAELEETPVSNEEVDSPAEGDTPTTETESANSASTGKEDPPVAEEESQEPVELAAAEFKELQAQARKATEHWDLYVRGKAELDNFRKRSARERQEAIRYANESLLETLLPIMDNFEMALAAAESAQEASVESIRTGVSMIYGQMKSFLTDSGLEEIDAQGKPFDPNIHEAISEQESGEVEEGTVLQQTRKGYRLRDRLIRPASVVVAKKPASE